MKKMFCVFTAGVVVVMMAVTASVTWANGTVKKDRSTSSCPPQQKHHPKPHCPTSSQAPCPPTCYIPCPPGVFHTEPYIGALIGFNHMWGRTKGTLFDASRDNSSKEHSGFITEAVLGWRYVFPLGFTAGFEVDGDLSNDRVKATFNFPTATLNHKLKRNFSVVSSLTFGQIFCCNWHAFVKLGIGVSWFKQHLINPATNSSFSKSKPKKPGFVPELGLEYGFNECFSVLGTVGYEIYERISTRYINPIPGNVGDVETRVTPKFFNVKFGILYRM